MPKKNAKQKQTERKEKDLAGRGAQDKAAQDKANNEILESGEFDDEEEKRPEEGTYAGIPRRTNDGMLLSGVEPKIEGHAAVPREHQYRRTNPTPPYRHGSIPYQHRIAAPTQAEAHSIQHRANARQDQEQEMYDRMHHHPLGMDPSWTRYHDHSGMQGNPLEHRERRELLGEEGTGELSGGYRRTEWETGVRHENPWAVGPGGAVGLAVALPGGRARMVRDAAGRRDRLVAAVRRSGHTHARPGDREHISVRPSVQGTHLSYEDIPGERRMSDGMLLPGTLQLSGHPDPWTHPDVLPSAGKKKKSEHQKGIEEQEQQEQEHYKQIMETRARAIRNHNRTATYQNALSSAFTAKPEPVDRNPTLRFVDSVTEEPW